MNTMEPIATSAGTTGSHTLEGIARVVLIEGGTTWLEPEQTTSCGGCASAASCGAPGVGSIASRIQARRFRLDHPDQLSVGERVVVGVDARALLKAALTAYAIPLATTLLAGILAEWIAASDSVTMAAMGAGLGLGLLASRLTAQRLSSRGDLAPRFLRRAQPGESCRG